jgi:hypothetical protein
MLIAAAARARSGSHRLMIIAASGCVRRLIDVTGTRDRVSPVL